MGVSSTGWMAGGCIGVGSVGGGESVSGGREASVGVGSVVSFRQNSDRP